MNKIMSVVGAVVAACSISAVPAQAAVKACADRDEAIMSRLMANIAPSFADNNTDLNDHSFAK